MINKFKGKLSQWKGYQPNLSARLFVLNHFLLPAIIYFLACWRPPQSHIKMINSLTYNFLWGGDGTSRKIVKVYLKTCMLPKQWGGLGLMDVSLMSSKLATKRITRSMDNKITGLFFCTDTALSFSLKSLRLGMGSIVGRFSSPRNNLIIRALLWLKECGLLGTITGTNCVSLITINLCPILLKRNPCGLVYLVLTLTDLSLSRLTNFGRWDL